MPRNKYPEQTVEKILDAAAALCRAETETGRARPPITVFLHFPPVWVDFVCREMVDTLHEYGVQECLFGHIHGMYNVPRSFDFGHGYIGSLLAVYVANFLVEGFSVHRKFQLYGAVFGSFSFDQRHDGNGSFLFVGESFFTFTVYFTFFCADCQ